MASAAAFALFALSSAPIWHPGNLSANYSYLLSPPFVLPAPVASFSALPLLFTALRSPQVAAHGTSQSKLFNALTLHVNGVPVTAGPGHASEDATQPVRALDLRALGLLRDPPQANTLALACSFFSRWGDAEDATAVPAAQLLLAGIGGGAPAALLGTGSAWRALDAGAFHAASGDTDAKTAWYHMRNENLNASARPTGWEAPGYAPGAAWARAALQPAFPLPLALEPAPLPALLTRAACSATRLPSGALLLDYGQEMLGGPNLTFARAPGAPPATFAVLLGEELTAPPAPPGVLVPSRSSVNYSSVWSLPAGSAPGAAAAAAGLHSQEFIQFRYVELGAGAPALAAGGAGAWVLTAPRGGAGGNPYELPCAASTPQTPARAPPPPSPAAPASTAHARLATASAPLDAVFALCAHTAVATSLDINVDSQTRQRDLCHVDAYITAAAQYAVFPAADASVQARTARAALQRSSQILPATIDFKASTALLAGLVLRETGDASVWADAWAGSDEAEDADGGRGYLSAQLMAGVRYYNASLGLAAFPPGCAPGASWSCDALIDWPTQTRDGYILSEADTLRNAYSAGAIGALAAGARALGHAGPAARYAEVSANISAALLRGMLRWNGSSASGEAYFADGLRGSAGGAHGAVHSTAYAVALGGVLGAADGGAGGGGGNATTAELAAALTRYLVRRGGYGPASCMTAKVVIEALYALGEHCDAAADFALELLSRSEYPSWGAMLAAGATTTLEAWLPGDKWNTDWAHPWCASPAFTLLRSALGLRPIAEQGGWARLQVAPQLGGLAWANATAPTPLGDVGVAFWQSASAVGVALGVPRGSGALVCLPPLRSGGGGGGALTVDGAPVAAAARGRLLCTVADVPAGQHVVVRA